ncbi:hypothetical protein [Succinimonas amylolytica]|uniref:hypothetical protein n=1 Tax=Succinimonas amylolytica TaxID=83769 RepID=UPI00036C1849|nr:hypothetical protein [Succinimonas amylolytica]
MEDDETLEQYVRELPQDLRKAGIDISVDGMSLENLSDCIDSLNTIDEMTAPV